MHLAQLDEAGREIDDNYSGTITSSAQELEKGSKAIAGGLSMSI